MEGTATQGPTITRPSKPREVSTHFTKIMEGLQAWRSEDHEDNIALGRNTIIEIIEGVRAVRSQQEWHPIDTAPTGDDDFYLVCAVGDDRSPFVVRGSIFSSAKKHPPDHHLSLAYLTHWMPLPVKPSH